MRTFPKYKICKRYAVDLWGDLTNVTLYRSVNITKLIVDRFKKKSVYRRRLKFTLLHLFQKFERNDRKAKKSKRITQTRSYFAKLLKNKQQIKFFYGMISEKNFKNKIYTAKKIKINLIDNFHKTLELTLRNSLFRTNFTFTPFEAKQLINHNFVMLNNKHTTKPNHKIKINDSICISKKAKKRVKEMLRDRASLFKLMVPYPKYFEVNYKIMLIICHKEPTMQITPFLFNVNIDHLLNFYPK